MDFPVGTWWQRLLAVLLCGLSAGLYFLWSNNQLPGILLTISCIATFLFVLMSIPPLYHRWMSFAEWLSVWVTRLLFTVIYFCILPLLQFLRYKDRLRLRNLDDQKSLWIERKQPVDTVEELQRMG